MIFLYKAWSWIKRYWYVPAVLVAIFISFIVFRGKVPPRLVDIMQRQRARRVEDLRHIEEKREEKEEKKEIAVEKHEERLEEIEERHEEREEKITEKVDERRLEYREKSLEELAREMRSEFDLGYDDKWRD